MQDVVLVGVIEGDGDEQAQGIGPWHGLAQVFEFLLQRAAGEVGHDQVGRAFVLAVVNDGDDVGTPQARQGFGLALEALEDALQVGGGEAVSAQDFDGDVAFEAGVVGLIDGRHPALAELFQNVVAS